MRLKPLFIHVAIATALLGAQLPDAPIHVHAAQQELPPVSYICPMDADVLSDKPGSCPICKMDLEPVRIDTAWSCPNHAAVIRDQKGVCPIDKRELVQVIVAKYWTCSDKPKTKLPDPGKCGDGTTRKLVTELRAHGDHNPRHGGSFFMAEDKWHHLEGTYPSAGLFRVFFYDNFTKPLAPKKVTGRIVLEEAGKEVASFPLAASRTGQTLEARLKGTPAAVSKTTPAKLVAKIKFDANTSEQRFDFVFAEYSKEPPSTPPAPRTTAAPAAPAPTTAAARPPAASAAGSTSAASASPAAAPATATAAAPPPPPAAPDVTPTSTATVSQTASAATLSRTDAAQLVENLPSAPGELVKLLEQRTQEVQQAIAEGQYGYVYIPALLSKDIALAIGDKVNALPEQRQPQANAAVRRLVLAAWDLDFYGDLGNKEKITEAFNSFSSAFADIKGAYASAR